MKKDVPETDPETSTSNFPIQTLITDEIMIKNSGNISVWHPMIGFLVGFFW